MEDRRIPFDEDVLLGIGLGRLAAFSQRVERRRQMRQYALTDIGGRIATGDGFAQGVAGHRQSVQQRRAVIRVSYVEIRAARRAGQLTAPRFGIGFQRLKDVAEESVHHVDGQVRLADRGLIGNGTGAFVDLVCREDFHAQPRCTGAHWRVAKSKYSRCPAGMWVAKLPLPTPRG